MVKSKVYKSTITSKVMAHNVPILKITDDEGNHHYGWYNGEGVSSIQLYINMRHHRLDGPAIVYLTGDSYWCINNSQVTNFKDFQEAGGLSDDQMCILRLKYGEIV